MADDARRGLRRQLEDLSAKTGGGQAEGDRRNHRVSGPRRIVNLDLDRKSVV